VKRKFFWKNVKMMFILALLILIILAVIITALVLKFGNSGGNYKPDRPSDATKPAKLLDALKF
jgi:hypothetical protein